LPNKARCLDRKKFAYLTFGSQIGHPTVRNAFGGRLVPIGAKFWMNLYNPHDDLFTVDLRIPSDHYEQFQTSFDRPGTGDHDAEGYLTHTNALDGAWRRIALNQMAPRVLTTRTFAMRDRAAAEAKTGASDRAIAKSAATKPRQRALLIGINEYPDPAQSAGRLCKRCIPDELGFAGMWV
jgi:hypothetical protein